MDPGLVPYNYVCVCVYVRVCACECVHVRVCVRGVVMSPLSNQVIVDPGLVSCASARVCVAASVASAIPNCDRLILTRNTSQSF